MKNILQIPENAETVITTIRQDDGRIICGVIKGDPHYTEVLALTFGTFVTVVLALEKKGGLQAQMMQDIRKAIHSHPLEDLRTMFGEIARGVQAFEEEEK